MTETSPAAPESAVSMPPFKILFVDDEPSILNSLKRMMRKYEYRCFFAQSGKEGLETLESRSIDLIISDMRMPEMNGAEFLAEVKRRWPFSVRFLLTGHADMDAAIDALNVGGINQYIRKPWDEDALLDAIGEGLRIRRLEREKKKLIDKTRKQNAELKKFNEDLEGMVETRTAELGDKSAMLNKAFRQLQNSYDSFVRVFSSVISSREQLVKGQSRQVGDLSRAIAQSMGLEKTQVKYIYYAALLHELGKLNLPDDLLLRAEANLTHRDIPIYQKYPEMGEMFLTSIHALAPSAKLIRQHTELFDGSGFPDGIQGEDIEMGARIIRVARDFIGLQSGLMELTPLTPENALAYVIQHSGSRYDPHIVELLRPLAPSYAVDLLQSHERKCFVSELTPGMELTRDLVNHRGILLMASGANLTQNIIEKLVEMEKLEGRRISVYVTKKAHQE